MSESAVNKLEVYEQKRKLNKKYGKVQTIVVKSRDAYIPHNLIDKIKEDIKKAKSITANGIASKYDLRVSTVKKLLLELESKGEIKQLTGNCRLKIFIRA